MKDCQDNTLNLKDRMRNQTVRSQKLGQGHGNQECKWLLRCHRICLPLSASHFHPHPLLLLVCSFSVFRVFCSFRTNIGNAFPEGKGKKSYSVSYIFLEVKPSLIVLWHSIADSYMVPRLGVKEGLLPCSKLCLPSLTLPKKAWEQSPLTPCPVLGVQQNCIIEAQCQNGPYQIFLSLWQILGRNILNGGKIYCGP